MVAESHPIAHPKKTNMTVCILPVLASTATIDKIAAQTIAHVMLYAVYVLYAFTLELPSA